MKIKRKTFRTRVPSMAMGDIAFNLLIFFVILARANDDSHLHRDPAQARNTESAGHSVVSVLVDSQNMLYLNGRQIGIANLAASIERLLGGRPPGERTVLLKVHAETHAQRFEPIIAAVSDASGDLVHVVEKQQG